MYNRKPPIGYIHGMTLAFSFGGELNPSHPHHSICLSIVPGDFRLVQSGQKLHYLAEWNAVIGTRYDMHHGTGRSGILRVFVFCDMITLSEVCLQPALLTMISDNRDDFRHTVANKMHKDPKKYGNGRS